MELDTISQTAGSPEGHTTVEHVGTEITFNNNARWRSLGSRGWRGQQETKESKERGAEKVEVNKDEEEGSDTTVTCAFLIHDGVGQRCSYHPSYRSPLLPCV